MTANYDISILFSKKDGAKLAHQINDYLNHKGLRVFSFALHNRVMLGEKDRVILSNSANYIFIASPVIFHLCQEIDSVKSVVEMVLSEYEKAPDECSFLSVNPIGVEFPLAEQLPESIRNLTILNRTFLSGKKLTSAELVTMFDHIVTPNHRSVWYTVERNSASKKMNLPSELQQAFADGIPRENYLLIGGNPDKIISSICYLAFSGQVYHTDSIVPVTIDMSNVPIRYGIWYADGLSHVILYEICRQLRCEEQHFPEDASFVSHVNEMETLLAESDSQPEYVLLIKGLDKLSDKPPKNSPEEGNASIKQMVIDEILTILEEYENVRVMVFSKENIEKFTKGSTLYTLHTIQIK